MPLGNGKTLPEAPPILGAYDNHRKQAVNRPLHATLSPGWNPPDDRFETRSARPWTIACDLNGAVCIENLVFKLAGPHHGRRDSDISRSISARRTFLRQARNPLVR